jgi:hypothetical protein
LRNRFLSGRRAKLWIKRRGEPLSVAAMQATSAGNNFGLERKRPRLRFTTRQPERFRSSQ